MSYQSDSVRKMQLLALLTDKGHPFGKFLWGELDVDSKKFFPIVYAWVLLVVVFHFKAVYLNFLKLKKWTYINTYH